MSVDLQKVLVIANSDVAESVQIADYYVAKRALNPAHRMDFALGTSLLTCNGVANTYTNAFNNVIVPVGDYIDTNGIDCVLIAPGVPIHIPCNVGQSETTAALGLARYYKTLTAATWGSPIFMWSDLTPASWQTGKVDVVTNWSYSTISRNITAQEDANNVRWTPHGIIGWLPDHSLTVPTCSFADAKRVIDTACAAEQSDVNGPILWGARDYVPPYITALHSIEGRSYVPTVEGVYFDFDGGSTNIRHDYTNDATNNPTDVSPPVPKAFTWDNQGSGSAPIIITNHDGHVGKRDLWGTVGSVFRNQEYNSHMFADFNWLPGCWGIEASSYPQLWMTRVLKDYNGSCFIGTMDEPFADGAPLLYEAMRYISKGYTMAETSCLCAQKLGHKLRVQGDPLYRPFPNGQRKLRTSVGGIASRRHR